MAQEGHVCWYNIKTNAYNGAWSWSTREARDHPGSGPSAWKDRGAGMQKMACFLSHLSSRLVPVRLGQRRFSVRVRYAPSPTGFLHLGGLRTALYNHLFAAQRGGAFVLRIEDTDRTREVPGAAESLLTALEWCGVTPDEGPGRIGGPHGPYVQSERLDIYKDHVDTLLDSGWAYRCFCTADRLEALRRDQRARGLPSLYDRACLGLDKDEVERRVAAGEPHVVRLKVPPGASVVQDAVWGETRFPHSVIDDQVLLKSDGYPTYHLASVVDDHLMRISHVIRGEEWLSSTPKHQLLYEAFGWDAPQFVHLPLLLNADRSKLSKRQGDVAVEDYARKGYLPEALVNFVALLGWRPGGGAEQVRLRYYLSRALRPSPVGQNGFGDHDLRRLHHRGLLTMLQNATLLCCARRRLAYPCQPMDRKYSLWTSWLTRLLLKRYVLRAERKKTCVGGGGGVCVCQSAIRPLAPLWLLG